VNGVPGLLQVYRQTLEGCQLYGPTNFQPVLSVSGQIVADRKVDQLNQQYFILLIMTDGEITDMEKTVDEIVRLSGLPLSIIIVGVGSADFSKMNILDADEEPLKSSAGQKCQRDIVQFVPFRDYQNVHYSKLAADVLKEAPDQLMSWMKTHGITPNQPPPPQQPPPMASPLPPMDPQQPVVQQQ